MAENYNEKAKQQRESIQLEKEYQDALRMSSSLSNQITSALNSQVDFRTQIGKKVKEHYKDLSSSIKQLETSEDIAKKIVEIENQSLAISKSHRGVNLAVGRQMIAANNIAAEALKTQQAMLSVTEKVADKTQQFTDALADGLDNALSSVGDIPVIGGMLSSIAKGPVNFLNKSFSDAGKQFVRNFSSKFAESKDLMGSLASAGGGAGKSLIAAFTGPQAIIAAVVAVIAAGVYAFYKVSAAAKQFREETGLLNSQTKGIDEQFARIAKSTASIGGSIEDVSKAAAVFTNEFDGLEQASDGVLTSMVALNKNFGIGIEEGAHLNKMFTSMGNMSANTAQNLINSTAQAAKLAGVAPNKVIKDMAENAEDAYKFFAGNPQALAKAAVEAAKLGSSLKEAVSVSKGLLDFNSSINAELEASAMLGTNINFNQARSLAAQGKAVDAQKAVVDEVAKLGDLSKLDPFSMDALAEASGMSIESLQKQISIKQKFGTLEGDQLEAANALIDAGKELGDISDAELQKQAEKIKNDKEMQSAFDDMGNQLSAIGSELLMALMPIGKMLMAALVPLMAMFKGIFKPIGAAIDGIMQALEPIGSIMKDIFGEGDGISSIFEIIGNILTGPIVFAINFLTNGLKMVMSFVEGIWNVFKGLITGDFGLILDGLKSIGEGLLRFFAAIPMILWDTFTDLFPQLGSMISDFFSELGSKLIDSILGPLTSAYNWAKDKLSSLNPFGGDETADVKSDSSKIQDEKQLEVAGSINDGIVQNGKIISTNPQDTLIATKEPDNFLKTLLENSPLGMVASGIGGAASMLGMGGAPAVDNSQLVAKIDELIGAVRETKDVFLDGAKVTSGISKVVNKVGSNSYAV